MLSLAILRVRNGANPLMGIERNVADARISNKRKDAIETFRNNATQRGSRQAPARYGHNKEEEVQICNHVDRDAKYVQGLVHEHVQGTRVQIDFLPHMRASIVSGHCTQNAKISNFCKRIAENLSPLYGEKNK